MDERHLSAAKEQAIILSHGCLVREVLNTDRNGRPSQTRRPLFSLHPVFVGKSDETTSALVRAFVSVCVYFFWSSSDADGIIFMQLTAPGIPIGSRRPAGTACTVFL